MWLQARAKVLEPERPALRMNTFTGREYIVSLLRRDGAHGRTGMTKDHTKTLRIRNPDKVAPDLRGRSVWLGKVEPVELELVSTTALKKILKTEGGRTRTEIEKLASGRKDGVLARDAATGHFRILSDADLKKASAAPPSPADGPKRSGVTTGAPLTETVRKKADELSLVSTQILRKTVKAEDPEKAKSKPAAKKDRFGGFNPYDNN